MTEQNGTLGMLYPHLNSSSDQGQNKAARDTALLEGILAKAKASENVQKAFFAENANALLSMSAALANVFAAGGKLLCMGNGGSSCDANHLAVEFNHPVTTGRAALPAINLSADTAMLTAIGNDVGFDQVFIRPLISLGRKNDALFGISTSGNSKNMSVAFAQAKEMGIRTFALLGSDGGHIGRSGHIDHCLIVGSDSVHRIQECHVLSYHILWELVHSQLAGCSNV
jgi:D-sedoheptulose 7-phosphate isomerase